MTTVACSQTIDIPIPKFRIGQQVKTKDYGVMTVRTWLYVPFDPLPDSLDVPYWDAGFGYITESVESGINHFHETQLVAV